MINGRRPWNEEIKARYAELSATTFATTHENNAVKCICHTADLYVAHSSSGLGHRPLKAEITGSNPVCATRWKLEENVSSQILKKECPLCLSLHVDLLFTSVRKKLERAYLSCDNCGLVFVPSQYQLTVAEQRDRYLEHNNSPTDPGYQNFLSRLKNQMTPHLILGQTGLDYGSGPGPALSLMLESEGYKMEVYDPIFAECKENLDNLYDFVVSTETAEHFTKPNEDFQLLHDLVRPGGLIGIMTSILYEGINFEDWYYRLDPTHISFYRPRTMEFVADRWNLESSSPAKNIYIFRKPAG